MYIILYLPEARVIRPGISGQNHLSKQDLERCLDCLYYGNRFVDIFFNSEPLCNTLYKKAPKHLFEIIEVDDV